MSKNILILCMILSTLLACKKENGNHIVKFEKAMEVKTSDFIKSYSLIPLETTNDNLLVDLSIVKIFDDKFFIMDCFSPQRGLYIFNMNGDYVGKVGTIGQGPGEYIMPYAFFINKKENILYIKDNATNKLLLYNLQTYSFINEIQLDFYASCNELLKDGNFVWYIEANMKNNSKYTDHIQITDNFGKQKKHFFKRISNLSSGMTNVMTYFHVDFHDDVYFHHPNKNEIYKCTSDSVEYAYSVEFENLEFPPEGLLLNSKNEIKNNEYVTNYELFEDKDKIICTFGKGSDSYIGKYCKFQNKGIYCARKNVIDDLGIGSFPKAKTIYNDYVVGVIYLMDEYNYSEPLLNKMQIDKDIKDINPILILYK